MVDELYIGFRPLGGQSGDPVERATYAEIEVALGNRSLTLLEDLPAFTVTRYLRGSGFQMATWFATNWWRLRWETAISGWAGDVEWRLAHSMAGAGGGFVWPNVLFVSDGDTIAVASRPGAGAAAFEPVRYLNRIDGRISATEFENKVDLFMESILTRLGSLGINDKGLGELWAEVCGERQDPEASRYRKLEAMSGYDPGEAPDGMLRKLIKDQDELGRSAIEEMAAQGRHHVDEDLQPMREVWRSRKPRAGGFRMTIPEVEYGAIAAGDTPWQCAGELAARVRKSWNLGNKPLRNKRLADLLGTSTGVFEAPSARQQGTPFAIRKCRDGTVDVYLRSPFPANRRFAVCRLIGDHLYVKNAERLLPATRSGTVRQKFQRAFAQELLCPYTALLEKIQTDDPDDDDIEAAAKYFHVSERVVKSTLVNRGQLDRSVLVEGSPHESSIAGHV